MLKNKNFRAGLHKKLDIFFYYLQKRKSNFQGEKAPAIKASQKKDE